MRNNQQGIALVVVILSAMILLVALLGVTSTLALSSRRTTTDQRVTLQAQYAAESGLSRANSHLRQVETILEGLNVPANTNNRDVDRYAEQFCGSDLNTQREDGAVLCKAALVKENDSDRFSLFEDSIPRSAYPEGVTPEQYWQQVFSDQRTETKVATHQDGSETWYSTSFRLTPSAVRLANSNNYRFEFTVSPVESVGEVRVDGKTVATRTVRLETPGNFQVTVRRPSFNEYVLFRNNTRSKTGGQLYFAGGEVFNGPVHTNGTPGLAFYDGQLPQFTDKFTTAAGSAAHYGVSKKDYSEIFKGDKERFSYNPVPLPTNNNNQLRASFGGDVTNGNSVDERELKTAWNVSDVENGVYYSKGDGTNANQSDSLTAGLYIKGDVTDLTFSTKKDRQVISITQEKVTGTQSGWTWVKVKYSWGERWEQRYVTVPVTEEVTTTFEQKKNGTWEVDEDGQKRTLSGDFNGMIYVDGDIASLKGDGKNDADIASDSKLTLTTTGDITVKDSLTYTDNPLEDEKAENVLGIYTTGGSVLLDGKEDRDLDLHATVMASKEGEGFGTINPSISRGWFRGQRVRINLIGGIIEDQSQTVGSLAGGGFQRNYNYDPRFADGYAPPFFPTQANWKGETDPFSRQQGLWEAKRQYE